MGALADTDTEQLPLLFEAFECVEARVVEAAGRSNQHVADRLRGEDVAVGGCMFTSGSEVHGQPPPDSHARCRCRGSRRR